MPIFEVRNANNIKALATSLDLPQWLVKALIVEYLPCRQFDGHKVILDYNLATAQALQEIARPSVILNGLTLFHNISRSVFRQRILAGFGGFPMVSLAKQEAWVLPEGKVSPSYLPFPQMNSDEDEGDWKLELNLHRRAIIVDSDGFYQWIVTTDALISADITQKWYTSDIFKPDELEDLRRINLEYKQAAHDGVPAEVVQQRLENLYGELDALRERMRKTILEYHQQAKSNPGVWAGYTEDEPPELTLFDEFALVKEGNGSGKKHIKVRSYIEPIFFHAAGRAAQRAREVRAAMRASEVNPLHISEEIEAAAECIILCAMCLEAYINGFVQDHLPQRMSYIEKMEVIPKWLLVPGLLGKNDCFNTGSEPFQHFALIIKWRNNYLAHYKHEFRSPTNLETIGRVSEIYSVCNAEISERSVKTVQDMIQQINTCFGFLIPSWIQRQIPRWDARTNQFGVWADNS